MFSKVVPPPTVAKGCVLATAQCAPTNPTQAVWRCEPVKGRLFGEVEGSIAINASGDGRGPTAHPIHWVGRHGRGHNRCHLLPAASAGSTGPVAALMPHIARPSLTRTPTSGRC